jgi:hypothetical protein
MLLFFYRLYDYLALALGILVFDQMAGEELMYG